MLAVTYAALGRNADAPEIVPVGAVPIRVKPVLDMDSPLLKLGGKRVRAKLPDRWVRQAPVKRVERKAHVSTKAKAEVTSIPPTTVPLSDAGTAPPEDAAVAAQVDTPLEEDTDAGASNVDTPGSPDGVKDGTETDPLKARAANLYLSKIAGFFLSKFHPSCAGLSDEEKKKLRAVASVRLGGDGTVLSYGFTSSGNADIDGAAKRAMDQSVGQQVPPPPENYPTLRQNSHNVIFVCRK